MTAVLATAVFVVTYVLIATERVHRVAAALGGAAGMVLIGVVDADSAFHQRDTAIDWNVIFLLLGMMLLVGVIRQTGLFEYLAIWAAKRAGGRPFRIMASFIVITAVASALLDNVTTVLLVAPVTVLVCRRLDLDPVPFLVAEVLASNIGGAATLIGDPPNIIIASRAGLSFNDFVVHLAPLVVVLLAVLLGLCRLLFRSTLDVQPDRVAAIMQLDERAAIKDARLLWQSLIVLGLTIAGFVLHSALHLDPSIVALLGAGLLVFVSRVRVEDALREVEWPTLAFFMGLFVTVGGLVEAGVIDRLARLAGEATGGHLLGGSLLLLGVSGVLSGLIDNIPYVATMSPVVAELVSVAEPGAAAGAAADGEVLWWALALGADLGGNATAVGASANVVVLGIAERSGHPISFWRFTRYGVVVAAVTLLLAALYVWLRYFVLAA
ncbi:MAG TPA: ArsB/NhaD family transporter [Mycobacteriales bacterium]|jgi:Na+/H+ antiporter NhaD/arsenite permease-like protein